MTWESLDWRMPDAGSESGVTLLPLWPMLRSAIAEQIGADAQCPVTLGELLVARLDALTPPTPFAPGKSFELLGTERRGSWGALEPTKGDRLGGKTYDAGRLECLVLEAIDMSFEALLGEGLGLGAELPPPATDAPMFLMRLPLTSVDNEEVVLISAFDAAVDGELAAHIIALQALAADVVAPPPPAPAPAPQKPAEFKSPTIPRNLPGLQTAAPAPSPAAIAAMASAAAQAAPLVQAAPIAPPANVRLATLPELTAAPAAAPQYNIDLLLGVNLQVAVEIGRTNLPIRDVLALSPGSIVELDKLAGEKVDVLVNGRAIAQGEVVVVDENFGVRITDVVARQQRLAAGNGR